MTDYFAHSENKLNNKHQLSKHLLRTAQLAGAFACRDEYRPIFKIAGLLHDIGSFDADEAIIKLEKNWIRVTSIETV
jgi:HD superfamily phosphohydrolase YqeK